MTERTELPSLATRSEAADALRVSVRTIDRLIASGDLVAVRPSRRAVKITIASIAALAESGEQSSPVPAADGSGVRLLDATGASGDGE